MTSAEAASIYRRADHYWFRHRLRVFVDSPPMHLRTLRDRLDDGDRMMWKDRFCARAVSLISFWRRAR